MIAANTKKLLSEINNHSGNKLKYIEELEFIIESSYKADKPNIFEEIIFTGKYLNGLNSILVNENGAEESKSKIISEFGENFESLSAKLTLLSKSGEHHQSDTFQKKFLDNNSDSYKNLIGLIEDLTFVKNYYNDLR
jgi:hypothetical protein